MTYHYRTFKGWRRITWFWEDVLGAFAIVISGISMTVCSFLSKPASGWTVTTAMTFVIGLFIMIIGHSIVAFRKDNKSFRNGAQLYRVEGVQAALGIASVIIYGVVYW